MTKHLSRPHKANDRPALKLSNNSDSATLCFSSQEDALNFARRGIEYSNCGAAFNPIELVESYVKGDVCIVLKMAARSDPSECDAVFVALPPDSDTPRARDFARMKVHSSGDSDWDQKPMFVGITEFVEDPEGVIPSLMRIERAKERRNLWPQVFTSPGNIVVQLGRGIPEREVGFFGISNSAQDTSGVSTLVEGRSEGLDGLDGGVGPTVWEIARKLNAMDIKPIRINLDSRNCWVFLEERLNTLSESVDMLLCASEPPLWAGERIDLSHGEQAK
ncbi:MAG: hypothetical protein FJX44_02460 [Alphaproteobacteria bacterium]|nr:hypothetical protein [Alphaproteobacteria bacterium]